MAPQDRITAVVGGGILGLSVARELALRDRETKVVLFEKEASLAAHQTGRNSGVIHSGLYYKPGSLKARTCTRGGELLLDYCRDKAVPFEQCGKVVVATSDEELGRLSDLALRGRANGVVLESIGPERLGELEPHARGVGALHVKGTGIVDYRGFCKALAQDLRAQGGEIHLQTRVKRLVPTHSGLRVEFIGRDPLAVRSAVNCTGLFSDRVARASGAQLNARVIPFRGEYFSLIPEAAHLCRNLIYPVPDPRFPFLGVHFTRMVQGGIECGPNAVFALAREGYRWRDVNARDLFDSATWPGTWKLFAKYWRMGGQEAWRSVSKAAFVRALQRLVPAIRVEHLVRAPAGVRALALHRSGMLVDDFLVQQDGPLTHVISAPSPAATAALAIAEHIVDDIGLARAPRT